jgi:ribonuclease HI
MSKPRKKPKKVRPEDRGKPNPKRDKGMSADQIEQETLEELLKRLGIDKWDILIVGDGSGSTWTREAGWAAVTIDRKTMSRRVTTGALNVGTVNIAEIMAYVQALECLVAEHEERRRDGEMKLYRVHILTDSDYCRQLGNRPNRVIKKNASLWSIFDVFALHGYRLHWHHIKRGTCALNLYCDELSKLARKNAKEYNPIDEIASEEAKTVYDINPDE